MAHGGAKTYLPTLLRILTRVCDYIIKYRKVISENLPSGSEPLLDAVIVACQALAAVIDLEESGG